MRTVQDLVFDQRALEAAVHAGDAHVEGDIALLKRFLATFDDHRPLLATR